jgi:hypothetical protein
MVASMMRWASISYLTTKAFTTLTDISSTSRDLISLVDTMITKEIITQVKETSTSSPNMKRRNILVKATMTVEMTIRGGRKKSHTMMMMS